MRSFYSFLTSTKKQRDLIPFQIKLPYLCKYNNSMSIIEKCRNRCQFVTQISHLVLIFKLAEIIRSFEGFDCQIAHILAYTK